MFIDSHSAEIEAVSLCKRHGFSVVYEKENKPRTDGHTIYVQRPSVEWTENQWLMWRATLYHEIGHNVPEMRGVFDLVKEKDINMASFFGAILNIVDDYRQEHFKHSEYVGRAKVMARARKLFVETLPLFENMGKHANPKMVAIEACVVAECIVRSHWQPEMIGKGEVLRNKLNPTGQALVDKIVEGKYFQRVENVDEQVEYQVVLDLIKLLGFDPEEEEENGKRKSGSKGDSSKGDEESETEGDDSDGTETDSEGVGAESSDKGVLGAEGENTDGVGTIKYTDYLMHKHAEVSKSGGKPSRLDYTGADPESTIVGAVSSEFCVIDYPRGKNVITPRSTYKSDYFEQEVRSVLKNTNLSSKLRNLLQVISKAHTQHGQLKGKVCGRSLYRAGMRDAGQTYQNRVFKRKIENNILDVAVSVLIDYSGSMERPKMLHAIACGYMINEALTAIGVPLEMVGYSDYINGGVEPYKKKLLQGVFKSFDDNVSSDMIIKYMADMTNYMHENADGDHILWAFNRLKARKEKRKLMIVLSDGSPCTPRANYFGYTKRIIDTIERSGIVELYGIGIMDRNVEHFYKHHAVINNTHELEPAVINVIKNKILNRN